MIAFNGDWLEQWLTMSIDNEAIINFKDNSVDHGFDVYPCHNQAIECTIQLISETSLASPKERHSHIFTTIMQRKIKPNLIQKINPLFK